MIRKRLLVIIVLLAVAAVSVTIVQAQGTQPPAATYVGSDKCATCHKPIHDNGSPVSLQDDPRPSQGSKVILADFGKMPAVITDTKLRFKNTDIVLTMAGAIASVHYHRPQDRRLVMAQVSGISRVKARLPPTTPGRTPWPVRLAKRMCRLPHHSFNLAKANKFTAADYKARKKNLLSSWASAVKPATGRLRAHQVSEQRHHPGQRGKSPGRTNLWAVSHARQFEG